MYYWLKNTILDWKTRLSVGDMPLTTRVPGCTWQWITSWVMTVSFPRRPSRFPYGSRFFFTSSSFFLFKKVVRWHTIQFEGTSWRWTGSYWKTWHVPWLERGDEMVSVLSCCTELPTFFQLLENKQFFFPNLLVKKTWSSYNNVVNVRWKDQN